ncbi:MAG: hypothetical protein ACM3UY_11555 [Methanocella sp.]|jgi:uncharacterized membrane protein YvbJ
MGIWRVIKLAVCPQCGENIDEDRVVCETCNAVITTTPNKAVDTDKNTKQLNARLEKALRRTELLSYAAAGLGLAIFAVLIIIAFV